MDARVTHARVAWFLAATTAILMAADVVVAAQSVPLLSETAIAVHGFPFIHGAVVGSALMGALIISRYERHPIGWLLTVVGTTTAFSLLAEAYAYWVQEADGPGPDSLAGVSAWVSNLLGGQLAIAGMALMFLLSPDGHLLSRRWRYAAWVTGLGYLTFLLGMLTVDPASFELTAPADSFGALPAALTALGFFAISGGFVASVVSMLRRLRASTGAQRQQLRLIALSATLIAAGIVCLFVVQLLNDGEQTWAASMPLFISYFLLPILFATAVLRHRLYDLDVIINRTFVVVAGVAFAAVGYTVLVVSVGRLVEGRTGGFWVSLLATAVVALAFQPLRRGVVRVANRVAYGSRAQPYEALAAFSRRLAEAPPPEALLAAVAEAAGRAVSARGATATLEVPGGDAVSGTWGDVDAPADDVVPVRAEGRELGSIAVVLPRGRGLRPADERLLEAVAEQTGIAFRNTSLAGRLAEHVARLDLTTRQLAESRSRLVEAGDAARRTLEAAIARDVLPFLATLPDEIRRTRTALADGTDGQGIGRLVDGTNHALEALRELTRGIFPTQLTRSGLEPALRSLLARADSRATLRVEENAAARFSPRVEAALYFCCAEAVRSGPGPTSIALTSDGAELVLSIGGVQAAQVDLPSITDRVEAAGGRVTAYDGEVVLAVPVGAGRPSAEAGDTGRLVPEV